MIEIKLPRYWIGLTVSEIEQLLKNKPDLWAEAIKRGKALARTEKEGYRRGK